MSEFQRTHFYNNKQLQKLEQFIAVVENFLIKTADESRRYKSTDGSWFIGAGLDVYTKDKPQRKKSYLKRVYNLGYGNGSGAGQKLDDISDILKYYKLEVLVDHGRMD